MNLCCDYEEDPLRTVWSDVLRRLARQFSIFYLALFGSTKPVLNVVHAVLVVPRFEFAFTKVPNLPALAFEYFCRQFLHLTCFR